MAMSWNDQSRALITKPIAALVLALAVAACEQEAGQSLDPGTFGNASFNNQQIQTGEKQYITGLNDRFRSEVPNTINFAFDSAQLDQEARSILLQQAQWIKQFPEVRFRVYGHTDAVGSASYNKGLGQRRANAAVRFLTAQGISRSRLEAVASFGETQPVVVTEGRERLNRRTVTEVSGFVSRHPTVMDGKYAEVIYREFIVSAQPETVLSGVKTDTMSQTQ